MHCKYCIYHHQNCSHQNLKMKELTTRLSLFIVGICIGFLSATAVLKFSQENSSSATSWPHIKAVWNRRSNQLLDWMDFLDPDGHVVVDETNAVSLEERKAFESHRHVKELDQDVLADALFNQTRVLCWVMTNPNNLYKKTVHVKATWGKRCNKILYVSSEENLKFPTVKVKSKEGRQYLWQKTRNTFQLIYDKYLDDAEWFIKADDDTYLILENLRYFLAGQNSSKPLYFGFKFKPFVKQGYMSGGASYVISKSGVKNLVEKGYKSTKLCWSADHVGGAEDVEIGRCLENSGVIAGDSRDKLGRDTFHPFSPGGHIVPSPRNNGFWYWKYIYYETSVMGPECCSDYSISFHYVSPNAMYLLEYMIYHMKPFGVGHYTCPSEAQPVVDKLLAAKAATGTESQKKKEEVLIDVAKKAEDNKAMKQR